MIKKEQIKKLNAREHIRLRPGMYIGSVDKVGMHNLIISVMKALCERNNLKTELILDISNEITILKFKGTIINQLVNSDAEKTLKALTGLDSSLLIANNSFVISVLFHLSSQLSVRTKKNDIFVLNEGKFDFIPAKIKNEDWLNIHFKLENEIFGNVAFSKSILSVECEKLAALNNNVQIELLDNRNGCNYHEKFIMEDGLSQLFNNELDRLNSKNYRSQRRNLNTRNFHIKIKEPELSLELVFMISNHGNTFEKSFYRSMHLINGGSHISYFKMRLEQLNEKLNMEFDLYDNDLEFYNLMTNIVAKHLFSFAGPTKTRIEDPMLVQIMKIAIDKLELEITSFISKENSS